MSERTTLNVPGYERVVKTVLCDRYPSFISIHNTKLGPALGGIRFYPYATEDKALKDVLNLSESMTYKAALAGLSLGGGKSVIMGDPAQADKREVLKAFAEFVNEQNGQYITAKDVGVVLEDIDWIAENSPFVAGTTKGKSGDPSPMTAYGCFMGMKAACRYVYGSESLDGKKIILQGLGSVGKSLGALCREAGAHLFVTDVDESKRNEVAQRLGAVPLHKDDLYQYQADIFSPCAMGGVIDPHEIPRLRKAGIKIIAGCANNQLTHEQGDGWRLHRERILYAPDYVINSGGLINVACELKGYDAAKAKEQAEAIYETLLTVFTRSREDDKPTCMIAREMALEMIREKGRKDLSIRIGDKNSAAMPGS